MKRLSLCLTLLLSGCGFLPPPLSLPRNEIVGPLPVVNNTPADAALACLSRSPEVARSNAVFAVHAITDLTLRSTPDEVGPYIPRDVAGMLVTALDRAGVRQVNRVNTAVPEFELGLAREQVLGDGRASLIEGETVPYRPIERGNLRGSDYVIDGSITQLDFNVYSRGLEGSIFGAGGGSRTFALTVGADLRVTDTVTTEIRTSRSYAKQAVGREIYGSVFRFFSDELFDVRVGRENLEGLHAGLRWMLAEAAYDIVSETLNHDGSCDAFLPEAFGEGRDALENLQTEISYIVE